MPYITEYSELAPKQRRQLEYKRRYKQDRPDWDDSMVAMVKLFQTAVQPGAKILDYGCGHGNFVLDELGNIFSEKIGIDVAQDSVTNNHSVDSVVLFTDDRLPFAEASFDAVIAMWVFEHVEHPAQMFQEVARVLKPGGVFAFVTPNKRSGLIILRRFMNKKLADKLLKLIYGREENDVFEVWYRTNTLAAIKQYAHLNGFQIEHLALNADPSYTSFNEPSYRLSKFMTRWLGQLAKPHLIGVLRKI